MQGQDDAATLTPEEFQALDRFTQLEKFFPFYKMDINGYVFHVNEAIKLYADASKLTSNVAIVNIDFVTLNYLQEAFGLYKSWSDLQK